MLMKVTNKFKFMTEDKKAESFRYCSYLILAAAFRETDVNNTQTNLPKENTHNYERQVAHD